MNNTPLFTITGAIGSLYPTCKWTIKNEDYETLWWDDENDFPLPELSELEAEVARLQQEWENTEYQRDRAIEYPDFKEYLDGIVKGDAEQMQTYINKCLEVKAKYPKPE